MFLKPVMTSEVGFTEVKCFKHNRNRWSVSAAEELTQEFGAGGLQPGDGLAVEAAGLALPQQQVHNLLRPGGPRLSITNRCI